MSPKKSTEEAKQNHSIFQLVTLVTWKIKKKLKKSPLYWYFCGWQDSRNSPLYCCPLYRVTTVNGLFFTNFSWEVKTASFWGNTRCKMFIRSLEALFCFQNFNENFFIFDLKFTFFLRNQHFCKMIKFKNYVHLFLFARR